MSVSSRKVALLWREGSARCSRSFRGRERRKQPCIYATGSAASAVVRCSSKCNIRGDQRAISDPTGELRDRTFEPRPTPVCEVHRAERAADTLGRVHSPLWPQLPEQLHRKPTDPRPLSNDVPPSTLELLCELRMNSMSFENLTGIGDRNQVNGQAALGCRCRTSRL